MNGGVLRRIAAPMRRIVTPEGLFIYDRRSGYCLYEPRVRAERWIKPLYAQVAVTERCNLSCWWCYAGSSPSRTVEMPLEDLVSLIDFFDRWGLFGVAFGGGEPFLYQHIAEALRHIWLKTGLDASITTNGYAAGEKQIDEVEDYVSEVRVSVRSLRDCAVIEKFLGRRFELGVNILVFHGMVGEVGEIISKCMEMGVRDFLINDFRAVGRGADRRDLEPNEEDYRLLAELIAELRGKASVKASTRLAAELIRVNPNMHPVPFISEAAGRIIAVTADMKLKPSSLSSEAYPFKSPEEIPKIYRMIVEKA